MADQRLNIIFSGDASQLDKTIAQTEAQLQGLNSKLKTSVSGDTFKQATDGVARFEAKLGGLTTGSIAQLRRAAALLKNELSNLSPAALQAPLGRGLSDSLVLINTELKTLEKQAEITGAATSGVFNKAFQGVRQLANILPGIGLAGLFGFAITGVQSLISGFLGASDAAQEAKSSVKSLNEVLSDSSNSVGGEVARVQALVKAATDTSNSFVVQKNAISELQKINKAYFGDLEAGKSTYDDITKAANAYTDALVQQAVVKGLQDAISELSKELGNAVIKYNDATKAADSSRKSLEEIRRKNVDVVQGLTGQNQTVNLAANAYNKLNGEVLSAGQAVGKISTRIKEFKDQLNLAVIEQLKFKPLDLDPKKVLPKDQTDEIIARARQFVKEFGNAFVLPDLKDTFFTKKEDLLKSAQKVLADAKAFIEGDQSALKIRIPVIATTETKVNADDLKKFLRGEIPESDIRTIKIRVPVITDADFKIAENLAQEFKLSKDELEKQVEGFMKSFVPKEFQPIEIGVPVDLTIPTKLQADQLDKLLEGFSKLGTIGFKAFEKIDFTNFNNGLKEGNKILFNMLQLANTLSQSIGQGLANAFNNVFDAVLAGKSVFKALGESVKALVVDTIKAVVQMFILRAVTNAIFPGAGSAIGGIGNAVGRFAGGGVANPSFGSLGGSRIAPTLTTRISGTDLVFVLNQGQNAIGRAG